VAGDRGDWIEPPPLPVDERDGSTYFLSRLAGGRPVEGLCAPETGREVQEVLAAAHPSRATGPEVALPFTGS
jgi:hypothetical protein